MQSYHKKYIKYKIKYMLLKEYNQIGGYTYFMTFEENKIGTETKWLTGVNPLTLTTEQTNILFFEYDKTINKFKSGDKVLTMDLPSNNQANLQIWNNIVNQPRQVFILNENTKQLSVTFNNIIYKLMIIDDKPKMVGGFSTINQSYEELLIEQETKKVELLRIKNEQENRRIKEEQEKIEFNQTTIEINKLFDVDSTLNNYVETDIINNQINIQLNKLKEHNNLNNYINNILTLVNDYTINKPSLYIPFKLGIKLITQDELNNILIKNEEKPIPMKFIDIIYKFKPEMFTEEKLLIIPNKHNKQYLFEKMILYGTITKLYQLRTINIDDHKIIIFNSATHTGNIELMKSLNLSMDDYAAIERIIINYNLDSEIQTKLLKFAIKRNIPLHKDTKNKYILKEEDLKLIKFGDIETIYVDYLEKLSKDLSIDYIYSILSRALYYKYAKLSTHILNPINILFINTIYYNFGDLIFCKKCILLLDKTFGNKLNIDIYFTGKGDDNSKTMILNILSDLKNIHGKINIYCNNQLIDIKQVTTELLCFYEYVDNHTINIEKYNTIFVAPLTETNKHNILLDSTKIVYISEYDTLAKNTIFDNSLTHFSNFQNCNILINKREYINMNTSGLSYISTGVFLDEELIELNKNTKQHSSIKEFLITEIMNNNNKYTIFLAHIRNITYITQYINMVVFLSVYTKYNTSDNIFIFLTGIKNDDINKIVQFFNLIPHENNTEDNKLYKLKNILIRFGSVNTNTMKKLLIVCEPFVGCTGDQSLFEVICVNKIPLYEVQNHKKNLFCSLSLIIKYFSPDINNLITLFLCTNNMKYDATIKSVICTNLEEFNGKLLNILSTFEATQQKMKDISEFIQKNNNLKHFIIGTIVKNMITLPNYELEFNNIVTKNNSILNSEYEINKILSKDFDTSIF
jgi:hypothetical protein